jgi:hypothetical protein
VSDHEGVIPEGLRRMREQLEQHYAFARWVRPTEEDERAAEAVPPVARPRPPEGFTLRSDREYHSRLRGDRAHSYVFESAGGRAGGGVAVQVVVVECSSAQAARTSVMDVLASQMAVRLEPADALGIGEVTFAPRGDEPTFAVFAKGTLAIQVQSVGTVPVPVAPFARQLKIGG